MVLYFEGIPCQSVRPKQITASSQLEYIKHQLAYNQTAPNGAPPK